MKNVDDDKIFQARTVFIIGALHDVFLWQYNEYCFLYRYHSNVLK